MLLGTGSPICDHQVGICVAIHCFPGEPRGPVGNTLHSPFMFPGAPRAPQTRPSIPLLPQQIDELLAGNFTQEDEDAILEELNAITQVQSPGLSCPLGDGTLGASAWWCVPLLCLSPESWFPDSLPTVIPLYGSQAASTLRAALRDLCRSGLESDPAVCCWPALVTHVWTERKC